MSYYNVGFMANGKYFNKQGEGIEFANTVNKLAKAAAEGKKYNLAIDASTTCTGFCLLREDCEVHFVFDYARQDTEKEIFFIELETILKHIVWGLDMNIVLIEQPILQARNNHSKTVLLKLCKRLKKCMSEIPELLDIKPIDIRPNSWKSFMYNSEVYKGGYNDKAIIAQCICDKYPVYEPHYNMVTSKDFDCFDAVGIMRYYLDSMKDMLGESLNFSAIEYTHQSIVWAKFLDKEQIHNIVFKRQRDVPVVTRKWNEDYNYYKNIKMASTSNEMVLMKVPGEFLTVLIALESGLEVVSGKDLYIAVCKRSLIKSNKSFLDYAAKSDYASYIVY